MTEATVMNAAASRCFNPTCPLAGDVLSRSEADLTKRLAKIMEKQKMLICSACKNAKYCSVVCQKADWREHKPLCKEYQERLKSGMNPDLAALNAHTGQEPSSLGLIDVSTASRQAFNSMVSNLMHVCAAPLGALFLAWRSRMRIDMRADAPLAMPPAVIIEIDHVQAAANGWKWPFAWSAFPYYGMLSGPPPYPGYTGPRPELHSFLRDELQVEHTWGAHMAGAASLQGAPGKNRIHWRP